MRSSFHPLAAAEIQEAVDFYESRQPGLGQRFASTFDTALARVLADPTTFAIFDGPYRLARLPKFPYGILYAFDAATAEVVIVAVMHLHRRPGYWKSRLI